MPNSPNERYFRNITRYHYYLFTLIYLTKLPIFWHVLSLIFISPPMTYTCPSEIILRNDGGGPCPCKHPKWNRTVFTETLQTKFNIICEDMWLLSFMQSMLYVGTLIGAFSFGFLSDRYGRLKMFMLSCLIISVAGCLVVLMPSISTFIIMRCIEGFGVGGSVVTGYVFLVEYCGNNYREMVTALFHVPINLSHLTLPGVSYLLRHCDHFQLALSIPTFLCCSLYWLTYESPKWLIASHHYAKATTVMQKIAKFNGDSAEKIIAEMDAYYSVSARPHRPKIHFMEMFKHRKLVLYLACMSFIYFVCGMGYYGVSQYIGKMSGNIYENVAISAVLLLPGTISCAFLLQRLGRRTFLMATNFLSGIFMIIVILIPMELAMARVLVASVCNCFFFMSFIISFLYGVELFPTSLRNSVLGFLSVLSRLGQIVAPPLNALPEMVSGAIFGVAAILGGILCLPLPETKNMTLPSTLQDTVDL